MEKKCAVCGNVIEEGARVCQHCGAAQEDAFGDWHDDDVVVIDPITGDEVRKWETKLKKRTKKTVIIAVCISVAVIALCAALFAVLFTEMQDNDGYIINNNGVYIAGQWVTFDSVTCESFDLEFQILYIESGDPYGTLDIYILKSDGKHEKAASMHVTDTSVVKTRVELDRAETIKGVAVLPREECVWRYAINAYNFE